MRTMSVLYDAWAYTVVLSVMHGHGAAVAVDVVAALAVGEDLNALDEGGVGRGRGQRVGAVRPCS